ncbi:hypothetical protein C8J28_12222 [Cereibacter azotoformans]|uniref:Uncharacterized protein n=1 Tax=Cereibacter azotoformans TaxID=43057 RepID=A0A2T5JT92_9RHOB|nr:hypothetical protein C8J28_12222 [Cereibacter azotoformans]
MGAPLCRRHGAGITPPPAPSLRFAALPVCFFLFLFCSETRPKHRSRFQTARSANGRGGVCKGQGPQPPGVRRRSLPAPPLALCRFASSSSCSVSETRPKHRSRFQTARSANGRGGVCKGQGPQPPGVRRRSLPAPPQALCRFASSSSCPVSETRPKHPSIFKTSRSAKRRPPHAHLLSQIKPFCSATGGGEASPDPDELPVANRNHRGQDVPADETDGDQAGRTGKTG